MKNITVFGWTGKEKIIIFGIVVFVQLGVAAPRDS